LTSGTPGPPRNVSVPVPSFSMPPVPEITFANKIESERLKASVPLFTIAAVLVPNVPAVPPLPICRVPPLIVVVPV
jgi:hypothetical protein